MSKPCVTILNAGPGMGFYVPGVIMAKQLKEAGIPTIVHVFENFYKGDKKNIIPRMKSKFHKNFSFALMGQSMATDPSSALNEEMVTLLLDTWLKEKRHHFVVFSGFWLSILNRFLEITDHKDIKIDLCHLDADYSVSWKMYNCTSATANTVWFHSWEKQQINYYMNVDGLSPVPFKKRDNNLIIHGGGWGLGDYQAKGEALSSTEFTLSIIAYDKQDLVQENEKFHFYFLDPEWNIWDQKNNQHHFPPLFQIDSNGENKMELLDNSQFSPLYEIIRKSKAIISKPGAGTLIDSLSSATPIIILEPYGNSENKNGLLWIKYGLGMLFEDWKKTGFSSEVLEQMHLNLLNIRARTENYINSYIINHGL
ncbi:hypothetical protein [Pedobacter sp. R20-19]|uniref:hypothetical protein n=1 Tax=Pedobacter sp. R20-19 TaxID=1270196 RepID=UPI0004935E16|nr:hypothetical protein [Pedobacter sp. R20-19]